MSGMKKNQYLQHELFFGDEVTLLEARKFHHTQYICLDLLFLLVGNKDLVGSFADSGFLDEPLSDAKNMD